MRPARCTRQASTAVNTFLRIYFGAVAVAAGVFLIRVPSEKTRALTSTMPPKPTGAFFVIMGLLLIVSAPFVGD